MRLVLVLAIGLILVLEMMWMEVNLICGGLVVILVK
jgi:hypothetical protein